MRVVAVRAGKDPPLLVESSEAVDGVRRRFSPSTLTRVRTFRKNISLKILRNHRLLTFSALSFFLARIGVDGSGLRGETGRFKCRRFGETAFNLFFLTGTGSGLTGRIRFIGP